jgi:hypothetical protein
MKAQSTNVAIVLVAALAGAQDHDTNSVGQGRQLQRHELSSRVQLVVEVHPSTSKTGEPVMLKLRLKNVSREVAEYAETSPEMDWDVVVLRENGSPAFRTPHGRRITESERRAYRRVSRSLAPGEEASETLDITNIFDLTRGGKYFARASHVITPILQTAVVEVALSSPVAFTITE